LRFDRDAERFMKSDADRLVSLAGLLAARSLPYSVVKTGEARHVVVRMGKSRPRLAFAAHYDRIRGSPGALDNSCACLQLIEFAARKAAAPDYAESGDSEGATSRSTAASGSPSFLVAFTDAEEAPGSGEATRQGAYSLALRLKAAYGTGKAMATIVLDVTGRGGRLLLSTAPAGLLARTGLSLSDAASGHLALVGLARRAAARAGIAAPLEADLPWSDDLGLTLGGLPALAISLLPEAEAAMLAAGKRPPLWDILHTEADSPELAEESSFGLMSSLLDAILSELATLPEPFLY
jgi:hypothetical protein